MSVSTIFGEEGSDESKTSERVDVRNVDWTPTCPECEGRVVSEDVEAVCADCGLVVSIDALERKPGLKSHAPTNTERSGEWAVETTNQLRTDKGLHTTFFLQTDGKGKPLSSEKYEQMRRLRKRHKRFTMTSDRDKRMNEGFRDIGMLGANLELPEYVTTQASRYLEAAKRERLPGGRMAWESLAAGAVLLAGRATGVERTPAQIARYAKTSRERVCAAARKIRVQTDVDAPVVRERAVETVVKELDEAGVDLETGLELARIAERLMDVADAEPVGPGTPRLTVAGAAVYVADRRTEGKAVTQAEVVEAVEQTLPSSKSKVKTYAQELYEVSEGRIQSTSVVAGQVSAD
ncbi:transcription initiation factor IIB [Halorarius litoreus]|uniref:transcription initiation factor IIB n=1 Tax=Halorarius litoreus TaxID=2962676 RepID=UPI0020CC6CA4|nr:transcription initiation factor IIB family protein [Halorarius litoreus]